MICRENFGPTKYSLTTVEENNSTGKQFFKFWHEQIIFFSILIMYQKAIFKFSKYLASVKWVENFFHP